MRINRIDKRQMAQVLIFIILVLFTFANNVLAQEAVPAPKAVTAQEGRRISMDFQEAELRDVLKIFSQQAGLNFVASKEIEDKKVTLYLEGVTVQDALNSIMKANNLTYDQAPGSSVFIVKESGKAKIDMITKVYTLNFARVAEQEKEEEAGGAGEGTTGGAAQKKEADIKTVLENLLSKGGDGRLLGSIVVDRRTNSVIITSIPEDFPLIEETIKSLDVPTPQALIEAEIVEIETDILNKLGLEWGNQTTGTFITFSGPIRKTAFPFIRQSGPFQATLLKGATDSPTLGTLSLAEFSVVLRALESEGKARYLAKPRLMVLNNETAEIKISADTAVGLKTSSQSDTGTITEEAERMETGVILKVTPTINKDDYITMTLQPEVSRVVASNIITSTGVRIYDPTRRNVKTTVMVKDGQSIAIGGLLKREETDTISKTPGLSKVPFLGRLFKSDSTRDKTTEIIIFITSHVIKDVETLSRTLAEITKPPAAAPSAKEAKEEIKAEREAEIEKTVIKLRKKRELSR